MNTLEKIHSSVLKRTSFLPDGIVGNDVMVFLDMGIGNAMYMLPLVASLPEDVKIVCPNQNFVKLIQYNFPKALVLREPVLCDTVVVNFLCQRNKEILWIIKNKIPCRIGHLHLDRPKYGWVFNRFYPMDESRHESESNLDLLLPFRTKAKQFTLDAPDKNFEEFDILIAPHSSNDPKKDWHGYSYILRYLKDYKVGFIGSEKEKRVVGEMFRTYPNLCGEYDLLDTVSLFKKAKLVIGNDGGLVKIADMMGNKTIQIFRWWTDCFVRSRTLNGINFIEPTAREVGEAVEDYIENYSLNFKEMK